MALIPDLGPNYNASQYADVTERANTFYTNNITMNLSYWTEATYDLRFFIGEQGLMTELYGVLPGRPHMYSFNRILRVINTITGFQRRYRHSYKATPSDASDPDMIHQTTADQISKVIKWDNQRESIDETISDAFQGGCVTGMYFLHCYMDYTTDPINGNFKVESVPYNAVMMDTFTRKWDMSDCQGIQRRSYVTKEMAQVLLPQYFNEIAGMEGGQGARDAKFQYMPEVFAFDQCNQLTYDEFYYRNFRKQRMLVDKKTGDTLEWKGKDDELLKLYLRTYPDVTVIEQNIPAVRQAILVNNNTLVDEQFELDVYPFVAVFTYFMPEVPFWNWRVQGIVRQLRDSQYLYNRRRIAELDILESRVTNALVYKPDALINPEDIYQTNAGRHIPIKKEYQIQESIQPMQPPTVAPEMIALSDKLAQEVQEIAGINEAMLGAAVNEQTAGILEKLRQGAGVTMLQGIYDALDRATRQVGRIHIKYIQNNYTPAKIKKIIGEEPTQEFYDKNFADYDCVVEQGLNTTTQRQEEFITLSNLRQMGVAIPDKTMIEAVTVQNKTQLIKDIEAQQQQAAQAQQQQQQITMQEIQSRTNLAQARARVMR